MKEKTLYEILQDKTDTDNIVIKCADGKEREFVQVATIPLYGEMYCILQPANIDEFQLKEDEAFVFKMEDEMNLALEKDEALAELVFDKYYELVGKDDEDDAEDSEE